MGKSNLSAQVVNAFSLLNMALIVAIHPVPAFQKRLQKLEKQPIFIKMSMLAQGVMLVMRRRTTKLLSARYLEQSSYVVYSSKQYKINDYLT